MSKSGYINIFNLDDISVGLNIEGNHPSYFIPKNCKWYNIVQVIDEPLKGKTFEKVMENKYNNKYDYIEEAVGIDKDNFISQLVDLIKRISKDHKNVLVHVHQANGSTILDRTLEEATGIKCILDEINFYEHSVEYKTAYPDIDALISISQCAGFNQPPGTWIIPTTYMTMDIDNNIIYTECLYAMNYIRPYVNFDYIMGNILVVKDLWNPNVDKYEDEGFLMLDSEGERVLKFVKESTEIFDDSHNWKHAVRVAINSTKILNTKDVLYLALLHDVCDHKYENSLPKDKLHEWIFNNILQSMKIYICYWIDQVSFSSQKNMDKVHPVLEAVRDGDRMEAIGEIGIKRCEDFTRLRGGKVPEDVVKHCHEKLKRLVPEGYIVHKSAEIFRRHNVIIEYIYENRKDKQMI